MSAQLPSSEVSGSVPAWLADAVWYQVFVSRFCNGCTENDPPGTLAWTGDWARLEAGEEPPLRHRLFGRRYGGDLQGLRNQLPYLCDLGVNTLYLNPIFQAPSEHKYDTTDHRHVDDTYGVAGSRDGLTGETESPETWKWSASDLLLREFLADAHARGFRVVLDGVFNHVGPQFWAWEDVKAHGRQSRYAEWFDVTDWGPPIRWNAWDGADGRLVNFRQAGDGLHPEVEAYLFAVAARWMDPDGDGDLADGIDGWRLDAAEKVPHGFWKRFRRLVKRINPEAAIVGEIWTDASEWLAGDEFDVVTHYPFSGPVMRFFGRSGRRYAPSALADDLVALRRRHSPEVNLGMLNLLGSHDTERAVSMLIDPPRRRTANGKAPQRDPLRPDDQAYRRLMLAALFQFTYPGAPLIYYGDEVGMYGGDDPFCRAPMWWPQHNPADNWADMHAFYRTLGRLRGPRVELRRGRCQLLLADDARRLLAFSRRYGERETVVLINADTRGHRVVLNLPALGPAGGEVEILKLHTTGGGGAAADATATPEGERRTVGADGRLETVCPALSGQLIGAMPASGTDGGALEPPMNANGRE